MLYFLRPVLLVLLPAMLLALHWRHRLARLGRSGLLGLALIAILVFGATAVQFMAANIAHPPEWDFQPFWLSSRLALRGENFYDPSQYRQLPSGLRPTAEFKREFLDVGLNYPPPTMLLFAPLGLFDIHTAILLWYVVNGAILALDIFLLWDAFLPATGAVGLATTAALMLMLRGTLSTVYYAQTNFIVLLLLLLFWRDRARARGGMWLAAGTVVKPLLGLFLVFLLASRQWRVLAGACATLALLSAVAIASFGPATCWSYFAASSLTRLPASVYTEIVNQSLLATILRLTKYPSSGASPVMQPLYLACAFVLTGITGVLVVRHGARDDWSLALTLTLALLLYPGTLEHYSVQLMVPILLLWRERELLPGRVWNVIPLVTLVYVLVDYPGGRGVFAAILLCWILMVWGCLWTAAERSANGARVLRESPQPATRCF